MFKEKQRLVYLTPEQAEKLKQHISNNYRDLLEFLLYTGLRVGEALKLTWKDVDFEANIIILRQDKTKTGRNYVIPLNSKVKEILLARKKKTKDKRVFPHSKSNFTRAFKQALKRAGLPQEIRIHDLRHTFASWLSMSGIALQQIAALLGHRQLSTTMRYAHLNLATLKKASESVVQFGQSG
jgi:integrase